MKTCANCKYFFHDKALTDRNNERIDDIEDDIKWYQQRISDKKYSLEKEIETEFEKEQDNYDKLSTFFKLFANIPSYTKTRSRITGRRSYGDYEQTLMTEAYEKIRKLKHTDFTFCHLNPARVRVTKTHWCGQFEEKDV